MSTLDRIQERIEKIGLGRLTLLLLAVGISASPIGAIAGAAAGPVIGSAIGNIVAGTCLVGLAGCAGSGAVRGATWVAGKIEGSLLWGIAKDLGRGLTKIGKAIARGGGRLADRLLTKAHGRTAVEAVKTREGGDPTTSRAPGKLELPEPLEGKPPRIDYYDKHTGARVPNTPEPPNLLNPFSSDLGNRYYPVDNSKLAEEAKASPNLFLYMHNRVLAARDDYWRRAEEAAALREQLAERDALLDEYEHGAMEEPSAARDIDLDPEVAAKVALWREIAAFAGGNDPEQGNGLATPATQADLDWLCDIDRHGEWVHDDAEVQARWPGTEVLVQRPDGGAGFTVAALTAGKRKCDEFRTEQAAIAFANKDFGYLELKEFDAAMSGDLEALKSLTGHEMATVRAAAHEMRDAVIGDDVTVAQAWEKAGSPLRPPEPAAEHERDEAPR